METWSSTVIQQLVVVSGTFLDSETPASLVKVPSRAPQKSVDGLRTRRHLAFVCITMVWLILNYNIFITIHSFKIDFNWLYVKQNEIKIIWLSLVYTIT